MLQLFYWGFFTVHRYSQHVNSVSYVFFRPPGTTVPDGLMFYRRCFFRQPHLRGPSADRRQTLPHDRNLAQKKQKITKILGSLPYKILGAKNMQNLCRFFFAPSNFDCEYLRNSLRYPNQKGTFSISIPTAF